jgi:hypothetical protein
MKRIYKNAIGTLLFSMVMLNGQAQTATQAKLVAWDGIVVAGYVNKGAFVNFGGPSIKLIKKPYSIGFGMLPSFRIKEDKVAAGATKNSTILGALGFGLTTSYRHLVVQVPFYYNAKTAALDGKWNAGFGVGYKF